MVFSSFPIYQDSPNSWNQQRAQLLQLTQLAEPPPQPTGPTNSARPVSMAERARLAKIPPPDLARIKCPRCDSNNTKFCYFNNYSLSQPRYFCKTCRRYWTHGGALRDVPVGGGCRRNKRSKTSHSPSEPMLRPPPKSPLMSPFRQASANVGLDFDGIQQGDPAERGTVALEQYRYHMPPPPPPPFWAAASMLLLRLWGFFHSMGRTTWLQSGLLRRWRFGMAEN
ncbi:hypothetical protein HPP92_015525 [Vanilla planifolia]|uniref:Dof zinc finger protein n=1 Tax=Vanilla planifolia TaxID=51239 RepID=A0A835QLD8_VANPL|nr:hypothetical protein HPP92_015525 [Vanilla planifolia]